MVEQKHPQIQHSQIDPDDALILFLDLQAGIVELTQTNPVERLRRSVGALGKLATIFGMPVLVSAVPEQNTEQAMLPEIRGIDWRIHRPLPDHLRLLSERSRAGFDCRKRTTNDIAFWSGYGACRPIAGALCQATAG